MYAICDRRIWSIYSADEGWRADTGASPHTDHVHLSFGWAGACGATSFWTGQVADTDYGSCVVFADQPGSLTERANPEPCSDPVAPVRRTDRRLDLLGSSSSQVPVARQLLGLQAGGSASLDPASTTWRVWGSAGPRQAARYGAEHWSDQVLRRRSAGTPVAYLQVALRVPITDRNGFLGAQTASAVRAFKSTHGLPECAGDRRGVVGSQCWTSITRRRGWLSVNTRNGALRSIASPKDTTPSKSPVKATPRSDARSSCRRLGPV